MVSDVEFLSVSNDTTIRRWLITGDCMETFHGHTNFIYSISLLADGQGFVSSGEDRTVKVWKEGECKQTITLPAQSVWSVCSLPNGDIVAGARYVTDYVTIVTDFHFVYSSLHCSVYVIRFHIAKVICKMGKLLYRCQDA